jgi:hypothetical protein
MKSKYLFGDYVIIEMHRHCRDNEFYLHKVIGTGESNAYVNTPVEGSATEQRHDKIAPVVYCVCCGVRERKILAYRTEDVQRNFKYVENSRSAEMINDLAERQSLKR